MSTTTLGTKKQFKKLDAFLITKLKQVNPSFTDEKILTGVVVTKLNNNEFSLDWSNCKVRHTNPVNKITLTNSDVLELEALLSREGLSNNTFTIEHKDNVINHLPRGLKHLWLENANALHIEPDTNVLYKPHTLLENNNADTSCFLKNKTATIKFKVNETVVTGGKRKVKTTDISIPEPLANEQKQNIENIRITENGDIIGEATSPNYKIITFPEDIKSIKFKTARTTSWLTFSCFNQEDEFGMLSIGLIDNTSFTGRIVRWNRSGFGVIATRLSNREMIEKPFNKSIPLGTIVRAELADEGYILNIYLTRPGKREVHWIKLNRNDPKFLALEDDHIFNRLGFSFGVAANEIADDGTRTLYHREFELDGGEVSEKVITKDNENKIEKYAILVTGGQSNMVGYDESLVDLNDYPEDERLVQWGMYGNDKNNIIPLSVHAHGYQDMRPYSNPRNTQPNLGTKGIHYPLAKLIKEQLKEIPEDYKILVINGSYGSTWFGSNDGVAGLDATGFVPKSLGTGAKWGVNSSYYLSIKKRIQKIFEDHPASKLIGFVWCQGEHENVRNFNGYTALRNDFINYVSSIPLDRRFIRDPQQTMFFMDSCSKWKKIPDYNRYMEMIKTRVHTNGTFVEIPISTDTNLVNGTGKTTSDREAHFGNNAYKDVIAPLVFEKIKDVINSQ